MREADFEAQRLALRRPLVLGAARDAIEVPEWLRRGDADADRLALLAALGLRSRFDRPAVPARFAIPETRSHDPDQMLAPPARALLRRLCGGKQGPPETAITLRLLDALRASGRQLHPFDYPALARFMDLDPEALDENARSWCLRDASDASVEARPDGVDEADWTSHSPSARAAWIRRFRERDPARARDLVAQAIQHDAAAVRGKLVGALATGLCADDVEFLTSLSGDRAASVRDLARSLLARIEGTDAYTERLEHAHTFLQLQGRSVIGRRRALVLSVPKGIKKSAVPRWIEQTFVDVDPTALASRLDLSPAKFAKALADPHVRSLFFVSAVAVGDTEMATALAEGLDARDLESIFASFHDRFAALEPLRRDALWVAVEPVLASTALEGACSLLASIYPVVRLSPPSAFMERLTSSRPLEKWLSRIRKEPDGDLERVPCLLVAFCDPQQRRLLQERLADLPPAATSNALSLARLLDAIEEPR